MFRIASTEIYRIFCRPRTYISFIAIAVIVSLIQIAMYVDGLNYISFITNPLQSSFNIEGKVLNGNMVAFIIIQTLILQIPLLVALVTGDLISGESANGTLRLLATRPGSRSDIVLGKFIAGIFYTLLLLIWLGLISWGASLLIFGKGDMIVLKSEELIVLQSQDIPWRFLLAFAIAFVSLSVVATFSLCLSTFAENSIGPIITTMAVIVLFTIIGSFEIPLFENIKPFLFTTHMVIWRNAFDMPLSVTALIDSIEVLFFHIILFLAIALWQFNRKDILT
jgi:ABC-2 type transport system permease protein